MAYDWFQHRHNRSRIHRKNELAELYIDYHSSIKQYHSFKNQNQQSIQDKHNGYTSNCSVASNTNDGTTYYIHRRYITRHSCIPTNRKDPNTLHSRLYDQILWRFYIYILQPRCLSAKWELNGLQQRTLLWAHDVSVLYHNLQILRSDNCLAPIKIKSNFQSLRKEVLII